jgi:hypothetical protein
VKLKHGPLRWPVQYRLLVESAFVISHFRYTILSELREWSTRIPKS